MKYIQMKILAFQWQFYDLFVIVYEEWELILKYIEIIGNLEL